MASGKLILQEMRDRLVASLVNGPALNCRPHRSRQRIDLRQLATLAGQDAATLLLELLGPRGEVKFSFKPAATTTSADNRRAPATDAAEGSDPTVASPSDPPESLGDMPVAASNGENPAPEQPASGGRRTAALDERAQLARKLRTIIEDARTYAQDTGVDALAIGFPLLSLPPSAARGQSRRVLAPLAFIPAAMDIKAGPTNIAVRLAANGEAIDRVQPNVALLSWLEQQTSRSGKELFADEEGSAPWREIGEIVREMAEMVGAGTPEIFAADSVAGSSAPPGSGDRVVNPITADSTAVSRPNSEMDQSSDGALPAMTLELESAQTTLDDEQPRIVLAAVLGLFPLANQGLLRDTTAMIDGPELTGPIANFLRVERAASLATPTPLVNSTPIPAPATRSQRRVETERPVASADPCQIRAVRLSREAGALIVHGPPGTGKSQTITNIVGDHLARGERVLIVCDKRTALDVVANRLDHLGLGRLCGVVHDPRRDQRQLYRNLREQLEGLADAKLRSGAEKELKRIDRELQSIHDELTGWFRGVMTEAGSHGHSLHELIGQWLLAGAPHGAVENGGLRLAEFEQHQATLRDLFDRAARLDWAQHPWREACGIELKTFLATPMATWRERMAGCRGAAEAADRTITNEMPPFVSGIDLAMQTERRLLWADRLEAVMTHVAPEIRDHWRRRNVAQLVEADERLKPCQSLAADAVRPLDFELAAVARAAPPALPVLLRQLAAIDAYLAIANSWFGVFYWRIRQDARLVLGHYGLSLGVDAARRLRDCVQTLRARTLINDHVTQIVGVASAPRSVATADVLDDAKWTQWWKSHYAVIELIAKAADEPTLRPIVEPLHAALVQPEEAGHLVAGLRQTATRAASVGQLRATLEATGLFAAGWLRRLDERLLAGQSTLPSFDALQSKLDDLENAVRICQSQAELPTALAAAIPSALTQEGREVVGVDYLRSLAILGEINAALDAAPALREVDAELIAAKFQRYHELERMKCEAVRDAIIERWLARQQERLLASTGSRLNSLGADLKRRLTMRGERALRLRQVVHLGLSIEGGDPLFDLCPVWMASPETVAQVFPRSAIFDIVIFDEASQCRLEEALPVILRGSRLVVAGDPQQLPPSRFFESAAVSSDEEDPETEQEWFEMQQRDTGDLLSAALGLSLEQCYLDVHYRSRNADLIEFSNGAFYGARLQPIPGHPSRRARYAPLSLRRVDGVYVNRCNEREAERVCRIVAELLKRSEPPSIGIACFNLQQRDLIVDKLDELAGDDAEFAARLAAARSRAGDGSFEGLFVKNLENVQGDERDHIIISTTYGPDEKGRFYRRFGPLGQQGGGRRLNVLVTRARQEVHIVTSIPAEAYRSLPPTPPGQSPAGRWLLFAYLKYAEDLESAYRELRESIVNETTDGVATASHAVGEPSSPRNGSAMGAARPVRVWREKSASPLAIGLARRLAKEHRLSSQVNWGNEGFAIDVSIAHPRRHDDATLGLLCDGDRYPQAEDKVQWDAFRSAVHESQGWTLARVWSPQLFRDLEGALRQIARRAEAEATRQDSLAVDE